jgi:hypothetical protein
MSFGANFMAQPLNVRLFPQILLVATNGCQKIGVRKTTYELLKIIIWEDVSGF